MDTEIYFKELAHSIVEAGKCEICRAGSRLETYTRVKVVVLSPESIGVIFMLRC